VIAAIAAAAGFFCQATAAAAASAAAALLSACPVPLGSSLAQAPRSIGAAPALPHPITAPRLTACPPSLSLQVILALTGNWNPTGGIPEYLKWAGKEDHVDFFTDPEVGR
jgi:hypothetical protein